MLGAVGGWRLAVGSSRSAVGPLRMQLKYVSVHYLVIAAYLLAFEAVAAEKAGVLE